MAKNKPSNLKVESLRLRGSLNRHPEKVADPLFATSDFFDPRDLVQVKYEMVRKVQIDHQTISGSAASFGFTRPSFYQAQARLKRGGLPALVPQKPGPRRRHKLSAEVMAFIQELRSEDPSLRSPDLVHRIMARFGRKVHVRSVERALARQEKKPL
ncbi:MAG: helix-turn-helix domain-containing protein [Verrucomicrobia bacterium]|nr:helix-turn-helix domain-containing protein [Verrucomicrobiota bacterium]